MAASAAAVRPDFLARLSDGLWRRPGLFVLLLLTPPLLWLGIIYVGSLFALLLQSFFAIDEFSGLIRYELTLKTYGELLTPANWDIILRTILMACAVTAASAVIAFPIAFYAARHARGRIKVLFYLGVMMPLWSSYLVKIYAWKLILAKEGIINWFVEGLGLGFILNAVLAVPLIGGNSLSVSYIVLAQKPIRVILINELGSGSDGEVCAVVTRSSVGRSLSLV